MNNNNNNTIVEDSAKNAVFVESNPKDLEGRETIEGYDFNKGLDYDALFESMLKTGFQASALGQAIEEIKKMISWRMSDDPIKEDENEEYRDMETRRQTRCKIFLGYTSNLVSSGVREIIRYLVQHSMVDVLVSTAGGVEEDLIKCLAPTYLGEFSMPGADLRRRGLNRIGNLLVPNDNYCKFEDWVMPILDKMVDEQAGENGIKWTPSRVINRLGREINDERSILYWCHRNDIPVYCPALTDGSIGDMMYFHSYSKPGLVVDIVADIRAINNHAIYSKKSGVIILGGGVIKHHICNANLFRNGAEYAVYVNTGQEFDGSDSGARPDEAVSWGKIKIDAHPVKIYADATLVFPILVSQTFVKHFIPKSIQELKLNKRDIF